MSGERLDLVLPSRLSELADLMDRVEAFFAAHGLPVAFAQTFSLAIDEIFTNIVEYAHEDAGPHPVAVSLIRAGDWIEAEVTDSGRAFDPLSAPVPDTVSGVEDRPIGGLGIFLVRKLMDKVEYNRADGRNHLRFGKRIPAR
jgi:serine/threonine-protein kinase RsbW